MTKDSRGRFITLEGIEGVGKSSALTFIQKLLLDKQIELVVTREPGGTPIAEMIRQIFLHHDAENLTKETEILLLFAGRSQHCAQVIRPALLRGQWVICDRFTDATYAYQGGGRGMEQQQIAWLEQFVVQDLVPDLTILLDAPVEIGLERMRNRGKQIDRIEKEQIEFFERVRTAYLQLAKHNLQRYRIVNANQPIDQVQAELRAILDSIVDQE